MAVFFCQTAHMAIPISSLYRYLPPTHILLSAKSQIVTQRQVLPSSSHVTAGNCEITIADCNSPSLLQQLCMGARILLSANIIHYAQWKRETQEALGGICTQNGRKQIWVERYLRKASQLNSQSVDNYATF